MACWVGFWPKSRIEGQSVVEMCGSQEDEVLVFAVFCGWWFQTLLGLKSPTPQSVVRETWENKQDPVFFVGYFSLSRLTWEDGGESIQSIGALSLSEEGLYKCPLGGGRTSSYMGSVLAGYSWGRAVTLKGCMEKRESLTTPLDSGSNNVGCTALIECLESYLLPCTCSRHFVCHKVSLWFSQLERGLWIYMSQGGDDEQSLEFSLALLLHSSICVCS
jgi:hypothetical protein